MKYFITTVIVVVALAIGAGLWIAGSPRQERMRRFDEMRVQALQSIQSDLIEYWQAKDRLPSALTELVVGDFSVVDPDTGARYDYQKVSDLAFRLCAQFSTSSTEPYGHGRYKEPYPAYPVPPGIRGDSWSHAAGRVCFERTIDKDFLLPQKRVAD